MEEHSGKVTFQGDPLTLVGPQIDEGDRAPEFNLIANDLSQVTLETHLGKVLIVLSVPSLDTDVCDMEARKFNQQAGEMIDDATLLLVSMDLPFAQKRWADEREARNIVTLSDHRDASFGVGWGVLIKELRLLARKVFVVDRQGQVKYTELVKEMTEEPDYEAAMKAARGLI